MVKEEGFFEQSEMAAQRACVAILYKNGSFSLAPKEENRQWTLLGSGVLIREDRVLTTGHVIGLSRYTRWTDNEACIAVFIPGRGIVAVKVIDSEDRIPKVFDFMYLLALAEQVEGAPFVPPGRVRRHNIQGSQVAFSGFGVWQDRRHVAAGLVRSEPIRMVNEDESIHNLDLQWTHHQRGPIPVNENSGGAVVYPPGYPATGRVVGVLREITRTEVVFSRIGDDRWEWLGRFGNDRPIRRNREALRYFDVMSKNGRVRRDRIEVGCKANRIAITLNATYPCRMSVGPGNAKLDDVEARLGEESEGRFLVRGLERCTGDSQDLSSFCVAIQPVDDYWDLRAQLRWTILDSEEPIEKYDAVESTPASSKKAGKANQDRGTKKGRRGAQKAAAGRTSGHKRS